MTGPNCFLSCQRCCSDNVPALCVSGHRNCQTVKGVSFLGLEDEYVMSGSDDGHIYVWSKADGVLRQWLRGDQNIVNCLEPHPHQPLAFATSGALPFPLHLFSDYCSRFLWNPPDNVMYQMCKSLILVVVSRTTPIPPSPPSLHIHAWDD